jgi:hypothetical protein
MRLTIRRRSDGPRYEILSFHGDIVIPNVVRNLHYKQILDSLENDDLISPESRVYIENA